MPLNRQIVTIPLAQGLDTKTDPKQAPAGKLTALTNGVFTTGKKLRKRYGTTARSASILGGGSISSGHTLAASESELLLGSGNQVYSWSANESAWVLKGNCPRIGVSRKPVVRGSFALGSTVGALHSSGIACYAYVENTGTSLGTFWSLVDHSTNQRIATGALGSGASIGACRVEVLGSRFVVMHATATTIEYITVGIDGTAYAGATLLAGLGAASAAFDCVNNGLSGASERVYVVYPTAVASTDLTVKYLSSTYVLSAGTAFGMVTAAAIKTVSASMDTNNGNVLVASIDTVATPVLRLSVMTAGMAVSVVGNVLDNTRAKLGPLAVATAASGLVAVWYTFSESSPGSPIPTQYSVYRAETSAYAISSTVVVCKNAILSFRPFTVSGATWVGVTANDGGGALNLYPAELASGTVDAFGPAAVSCADDGIPGRLLANRFPISRALISGTSVSVPAVVTVRTRALSGTVVGINGADLVTYSFDSTPAITTLAAKAMFWSGGALREYDGARLNVAHFVHNPGLMSGSTSAVGGSIAAGVYQYYAIFERVDATGAIVRSGLSSPLSLTTTGATSTNTVIVQTYRHDSVSNWTKVVLYRTLVNGTVLYRLAETASNSTVNSVTFTDTSADASISGNEVLYTTGGVLENVIPPSFSAMTVYRNRLVGISAEKPTQIWYSKQIIPGQPAEFSDLLVLNMDPVGGPCTALAALDDKLIVFKAEVAYYLTGTGPDSTGGQNDFSVPILINTNSGCVEPRSVITAANGVLYKSRKGIFILDRSLQDNYIGAGVETYNSLSVRSVALVPTTNEVRFVMSDGTVLAYDFYYEQWSQFTGLSAVDSCIWGNVWQTLKSTGVQSYEDPTVFTDNGTHVPLAFRTAWLTAGDLQSFLRVYKVFVLGDYKTPHTLSVYVYTDYKDASPQQADFAIASDPSLYQYRVNLAKQKLESISVLVSEAAGASPGTHESMSISALSFEVGLKGMPMKVPAGSSA